MLRKILHRRPLIPGNETILVLMPMYNPKIAQYRSRFYLFPLLMVLWNCSEINSDTNTQEPVNNTKAIAGTVSIQGNVMTDSDVNDINASYLSNDSPTTAQTVPNPVLIGGYVNIPGTGPQGRSTQSGDVDDYYSTTLLAGQHVRLIVGDPGDASTGINLDLTLFDSLGQASNAQGSGSTKTVTANTTGEYIIRVRALSGASNYVLNLTLDAFQVAATDIDRYSANQDLDLDREFVPGEIIVKLKDAADNTVLSNPTGQVLRKKAGEQGRNSLFTIDDFTNTKNLAGNEKADKFKQEKSLKQKTLDVVKSLRQRPDVESARPNYIRRATAIPNDPYFQYQWHYPQINLPQAWEVTTGKAVDGHEVIVAIIDTGILPDHPDLQGQLAEGYDFIRDISNADDGDGIDDDPLDQGDGVFAPNTYHGTHVAGTIAAASNNNQGVAGIAWGAKIMPLRVLGKQGGTDYDIEQAIRFAAGLDNDSGRVPAQRADVINLSLGGYTDSTTPPEAFTLARHAGVIIVAAAGNEASSQLSYPASLDGVVSVSAVGIDKNLTYYSNYGTTVDVAAPGGDAATDLNSDGYADGILSTLAVQEGNGAMDYLYAFYQGTSMAAPHVAGVVALMKSVYPQMTPQQFDQWLDSGLLTEDLGSPGRDNYYGNGLIDAYKAVDVASNAAGNTLADSTPMISASISVLNFSSNQYQLNFVIDNSGGGSVTVQTVSESSTDWLDVSPLAVDSSGLGIYSATLNRELLPINASILTANISIDSSAGTLLLPVLVLNDNQTYQNDAGLHYIRLLDIDSGKVIKQVQSMAINGQYPFTMDNIPFGHYILVAGSNPDNDGLICNIAEACAEYPSVGLVEEITIDESSPEILHLDFETNFNQIAISQGRGSHYLP